MKESLATKRAKERGYFDRGPEWFCEFKYSPVNGIGYEQNINRRDPSAVIMHEGLYYTWYTRNEGPSYGFGSGDLDKKTFPWDLSEIWYATSTDGVNWTEKGIAVGRGEAGSFDDRSVFTPEILAHDGKFYLVYQTVQHPYLRRSLEFIAMAVAESPEGPWRKVKEPLIKPSNDGEWLGEEDNRFLVKKKGSFDSHKVHDPVLFYFNNKFYLYYKGEPMGEEMFMGGRETKWGLAISEHPEGPYVKSEYNPVSNSGHETFLWQYNGGMAGLLSTDGMEKHTIQYAKDGINFEIMSVVKNSPEAPGPFRGPESKTDPVDGLKWGLYHHVYNDWNYIARYDINTELRDFFLNRKTYE